MSPQAVYEEIVRDSALGSSTADAGLTARLADLAFRGGRRRFNAIVLRRHRAQDTGSAASSAQSRSHRSSNRAHASNRLYARSAPVAKASSPLAPPLDCIILASPRLSWSTPLTRKWDEQIAADARSRLASRSAMSKKASRAGLRH